MNNMSVKVCKKCNNNVFFPEGAREEVVRYNWHFHDLHYCGVDYETENSRLEKENVELKDRLGYNCNCEEYSSCDKCDTIHDRNDSGELL